MRVNDRRVDEESGKRARFKSVIVPPWCRRSPKVTVRLRTKVTNGPGSRTAGLAMAFKLIAEGRWRCVNGAHLVALVRAGARFRKGVLVESEVQEGEVAA